MLSKISLERFDRTTELSLSELGLDFLICGRRRKLNTGPSRLFQLLILMILGPL